MTDPKDEYAALIKQATGLLGSQIAVSRWLGYDDHGTLNYRLNHPKTIHREQIVAIEELISRVTKNSKE